ncbi:hypothetical protein BCh11DRAFT_04149 [Burkholderia sp. Ch1-1]|uniref:Uncharacterized protein n=1 Tax=Paraburkholderia phytofirmans OLGA172 TaxID=1417228 RepID=A0A160FHE4_9BURK|nr:hypothetical protein [Paraburkholderia phytofirmans]ANB71146.1 hypothetical protein AYM40_01310 [Paraburkholderia phytofirmans OLGA172]EIF28729.1 hypothetical protein BCh11DRAFT_04149 [Burkholderia sp. Ch1-1]
MGRQEGFSRLAKLIRGLGVLAAGLVALFLWPLLSNGRTFSDNIGFVVADLVVAAALYFAARAVAWVIDGFAGER